MMSCIITIMLWNCILDLQKGSYMCNFKYLEIHFWNIQFIISQECTEQLVFEMPAILDSLFLKVVNTTSSPIGVEGGGATKWWALPIQKNYMAKWHQFRLFSAPHITKCSYIDAQPHQPLLWWFPASCLSGRANWSHLQTIWALVNTRQAREWGLSKSRSLNLWQCYKHKLLVYSCICQMAVKNDTWNCACIRPLLANLVTYSVV